MSAIPKAPCVTVRKRGTTPFSRNPVTKKGPYPFFLSRLVLLAALAAPIPLLGDAGVLIPSGSTAPDASILSLDQMAVDIRIDNGDARVSVRQIFASHRGGVLEGEYLFSMPGRATVSDFAVWDGVTRIPGVILERRRAEEIYERLMQQQIDPGLLQQGERGTEGAAEATRTSAFSARIAPIPGFGTKRLEMEYHEVVPVENLRSAFVNRIVTGICRRQRRARHAARDVDHWLIAPPTLTLKANRLWGSSFVQQP